MKGLSGSFVLLLLSVMIILSDIHASGLVDRSIECSRLCWLAESTDGGNVFSGSLMNE